MKTTILAVLDAERPSLQVLEEAFRIAQRAPDNELHVAAFAPATGEPDPRREYALVSGVEHALSFLSASSVARPPRTHVHLTVTPCGPAQILRIGEELGADHVVIGEHSFPAGRERDSVIQRLMKEMPGKITYVVGVSGKPASAGAAEAERSEPPVTSPKARILLAEDNAAMRRLMSGVLREEGYRVIEARNGIDLLDNLADDILFPGGTAVFDLIVSDVRMPGVSGLDVLAGLRAAESKLPMIVITAFGSPGLHAAALADGAACVLDKPFDMEALRTAVADALRSSGRGTSIDGGRYPRASAGSRKDSAS